MPAPRPSYAAGIVHYRAYDDLSRCLASLARQTCAPRASLVLDHDADAACRSEVAHRHPQVRWRVRPNRGFAAGANQVLAWVERSCPDADFVLILNPDVVLEPGYVEATLREMERHPDVALAGGKLLRPDGRTLDSAGIHMPRHRRPRDRGAGEPDLCQYDACERVFAVTGAALVIRRAALPDLELAGEVFDEDFFAYHEDTDLAWRARCLGWHSLYVPAARALHRRGWRSENRRSISSAIRRHSFKNHYLEMVKNEEATELLRDLPVIALWEVLRFGFCLLRDPALLPAYAEALRLAPRAWSKRRAIQRRKSRSRIALE